MDKKNNGIDLDLINGYVEAIKADTSQAKVTFVAKSQWKGGARVEAHVGQFKVNGADGAPADRSFTIAMDEPAPLGGTDTAPNPAEVLASALCGCLTAGIATNAALFGTELEAIEVTTELNWDMRGILGMDREVPNQAAGIHYTVRLKGKAAPEALTRSKETLDRKSAVLNTLKFSIPVTTDVVIE